jgi:hypothetical protein
MEKGKGRGRKKREERREKREEIKIKLWGKSKWNHSLDDRIIGYRIRILYTRLLLIFVNSVIELE